MSQGGTCSNLQSRKGSRIMTVRNGILTVTAVLGIAAVVATNFAKHQKKVVGSAESGQMEKSIDPHDPEYDPRER